MGNLPYCPLCDLDIELGQQATILRVGIDKRSEKSKQWYFHPEMFDDNLKEKWFHERCIAVLFDLTDLYEEGCCFRACALTEDLWYCEMESAVLECGANGMYVDSDEDNNRKRIYACWDCIFDGISEGDPLRARQMLGMDDGGEDDLTLWDTMDNNRWINDRPEEISDLPTSRRVPRPPKRRRAIRY